MIAPASVPDLCDLVRTHNDDGTPITVVGGGTLHAMGNRTQPAVTLTTTALDALIAHERHDLTCAVQSGMRLRDFVCELADRGQFVPLDAPLPAQATLGGVLSAGWLGARRHRYGSARDFVIGSEVVLADGRIAHAGGMVVKNVTGYDMSKLYVGSFGTLGIFTRLNFKTLPVAQKRRALLAALPEGTRSRAISQVSALTPQPAAAFFVEGFRACIDGEDGIDGRMIIFIEGTAGGADRTTREARSAIGRAGVPETLVVDSGAPETYQRVLDAAITPLGERSLTVRSMGLPSTAEQRAIALRDACHAHRLFTEIITDVFNGDVFLRISDRDAPAFAAKIEACDDDVRAIDARRTVVSGDAPIRSSIDAWGELPSAFAKMQQLKRRFDPNGILNRGRFVGGI